MLDEPLLFFLTLIALGAIALTRRRIRGGALPRARANAAADLTTLAEQAFASDGPARRPKRFDRDVWREIEMAREEAVGHPIGSPRHVFASVRWRRALDEQLARLGARPSTRPDDWLTTYAAGRVGLPPASWERAPAKPVEDQTPSALKRAGEGAHGPARADLLRAVLVAGRAFAGLQGRAPRALTKGAHDAYQVQDWPWGQPYLHVFAREPAAGVEADLMLSYGVKGCVFGFAAIIIETRRDRLGRASDRATAVTSAREETLSEAGYAVLAFDPGDLERNVEDCARACLTPVRSLLAAAV